MVRRFYGIDKQVRFEAAVRSIERGDFVLDVGGGLGDFLDFAGVSGVVADLPPRASLFGELRMTHPFVAVRGKLPFRDGSFAVVVSLDTLEHVPKESRVEFVQEVLRVSRSKVILTFPEKQYFLPLLLAIARFYEVMGFGPTMRKSLDEHLRNGLPSSDSVLASVNHDEWEIRIRKFFGIGGSLFWLAQLALPFLSTTPFNRAMGFLLARGAQDSGGEVLLQLERRVR